MTPFGKSQFFPPMDWLPGLVPAPFCIPETRRHAFFSFHFSDLLRVNDVRFSQQIMQRVIGTEQHFYDRSLHEKSKRERPESLKSLIRDGVQNSSVICVLVGRDTWIRRWVRYEIARSVIDMKGIVAIDIYYGGYLQFPVRCSAGPNPLDFMGIAQCHDGRLILCHRYYTNDNWYPYGDYTYGVALPNYLPKPPVGFGIALSYGTQRFDWNLDSGVANLPVWLDQAATNVGR